MKSNPSRSISRNKLIYLAAFTALFLIYVAFPTKNYYYDGVFFARAIEEATTLQSSLIHPNHLIYSPFGYFAYRLTQALGFTVRALQVLQVVNSLASVLAAYVLFRILSESFRSRYLAWCLTFLFAFSATWWKFSTDADAYVISVLLMLIGFYLILPTRTPRPWLLIATFSLAVFFHQLAILFYPITILGLVWQTNFGVRRPVGAFISSRETQTKAVTGHRTPKSVVLQFAVGAFVLILAVYCFAFYLAAGTFSASRFARWIMSYSPDASFSFNALDNLRYTLRGHARLFFGGRFSLLQDLRGSRWSVLLFIWIVLIGLFFLRLLRTLRRTRSRHTANAKHTFHLDHFAKLCIFWIVIFSVFLFFWLPHNTFYRLFYLPAIILLAAWFISKRLPPSPKYRLALFVAIMALANLLFSIFPYAQVEQNPPLALALELNNAWPEGTVVYYTAENSDNNLVRYFNPKTKWKPLTDLRQLQADLSSNQSQGKTTWLETTAIDRIRAQEDGANWLADHVNPETPHELINRAYRIRFFQINP